MLLCTGTLSLWSRTALDEFPFLFLNEIAKLCNRRAIILAVILPAEGWTLNLRGGGAPRYRHYLLLILDS